MSTKSHAVSILAAATIAAGLVSATNVTADAQPKVSTTKVQAMPKWMHRPCPEEDSVNCFWDAGSRGNGVGHSFYVRQFPGKAKMVCVMYVKPRDARRWDYCEATR